MALKLIKNKIRATQRTGKVTKAMEAVSAVKMRKTQERALSGRAYARAALRILAQLSATNDGREHPFAVTRPGTKRLYIIVTSDKGLAGNVNSAVLKMLESEIADINTKDLSFITFGRKATDYLLNRGHNVLKSYLNVSDEVSLTDMEEVVALAAGAFATSECDKVYIIYQNFISTFEQKPSVHQLLPLTQSSLETIVRNINPARGKFAEMNGNGIVSNYTIEPNAEEIIALLVPDLLEIIVYHALLESKASEHSARMVAMKNATDKAKEMTKSLTIKFNKERQAVITREVSEITGGIEAMAQK